MIGPSSSSSSSSSSSYASPDFSTLASLSPNRDHSPFEIVDQAITIQEILNLIKIPFREQKLSSFLYQSNSESTTLKKRIKEKSKLLDGGISLLFLLKKLKTLNQKQLSHFIELILSS